MEYIDNTQEQKEREILKKYAFSKFIKQNRIWGIFLISFLTLYIVKIFFTSPDIIICDKTNNLCIIEEKLFYATQYTLKEKFNITDIKRVIYYSPFVYRTGLKSTNILLKVKDKRIYVYDRISFIRGLKIKEQKDEFNKFLVSNQQKLVLKEPLAKTIPVLILFFLICLIYYTLCLSPRTKV